MLLTDELLFYETYEPFMSLAEKNMFFKLGSPDLMNRLDLT